MFLISNQQSLFMSHHCVKYRNFTQFPGVEILWKGTVSEWFRANHPKLCRNCAFPQNFHTRKLGEITVFYAVSVLWNVLLLSSIHLLVRPSVCNAKSQKWLINFFWLFIHEVGESQSEKIDEDLLFKKSSDGSNGQKKSPKMCILGFWHKSFTFILTFVT